MDIYKILDRLGKIEESAKIEYPGEKVGQKPGDQVRGTEKATPKKGKHPFQGRLVGASESIIKELGNVAESKRTEWDLREAYKQFVAEYAGYGAGGAPTTPAQPGQQPATGQPPAAQATPQQTAQQAQAAAQDAVKKQSNITAGLNKLKQVVPDINPGQAAKSLTKVATGQPQNSSDKSNVDAATGEMMATLAQDPTAVSNLKSWYDRVKTQQQKQQPGTV
jgi:hypothetical protein